MDDSDSKHPEWHAFHLYYHEDPERLLREVVDPLVANLGEAGWIERFFFLFFSLGGRHVRLRLRVPPGWGGEVEGAVRRAADELFRRRPSERSVPEEELRERNRQILAHDPNETDDVVYPDNSVQVVGFHPETGRYGGPERLSVSLDFFTASSLEALSFHRVCAEQPRSRQLTAALRVLLSLAWGLSGTADQLVDLAGYAQRERDPWTEAIVDRGDQAFDAQEEQLVALASSDLGDLEQGADAAAPGERGWLPEAARRFVASISDAGRPPEDQVLVSHLHMTANRLGLTNPEEVYLSRLLTRTLERVEERDPELWERVGTARPHPRSSDGSLAAWVEPFVTGGGRDGAEESARSTEPG